MKRVLLMAFALIWIIPVCTCAAAEDFYSEYTPRSANSSVFYIDVYSRREVTAAVFELSFADDMISYYSVVPADSAATVRDHAQKGKVTAAFADSSAVSGKLCRFSFKALQTGTASITLHMCQAAGADKELLSGWKDHTLTVKFGKDDVVSSSSGVQRTDKASSEASASKRGGGKSDLDPGEDGEDGILPGLFDLRRDDNKLKWVLIGAGIPLLVGSLVWLGILIGRRSKDKATPKAAEEPVEDSSEEAKKEPGESPEPDAVSDDSDTDDDFEYHDKT